MLMIRIWVCPAGVFHPRFNPRTSGDRSVAGGDVLD